MYEVAGLWEHLQVIFSCNQKVNREFGATSRDEDKYSNRAGLLTLHLANSQLGI